MCGGSSCTEHAVYKQEVQAWGYKLLSARTLGQGTDVCLLEAIITVHIHSDQELVILTKNVRAVQGGKGKECRAGVNLHLLHDSQERARYPEVWSLQQPHFRMTGSSPFDLGRMQGIGFDLKNI